MRKRPSLIKIALCLAVTSIAACGGSDDHDSKLMVVHASPDAPDVDVLIDGGRVISNVPYQAQSPFLDVEAGQRRIQVNVAGTETTAIDVTTTLEADKSYTAIAIGKVSDIRALLVETERTTPADGTAKVRVVHAAPSAPTVDVYVVASGENAFGAAPVLAGVPFGVISDYLTLSDGEYDLVVTPANVKTAAIEARNVKIASGSISTVAALDAPGGGAPFTLKVYNEN